MQRRQFLQASVGAASSALLTRYARAQTSGPAPTIEVASLDGGARTLTSDALNDLRDGLHGALLLPRDDGYDATRRLVNSRFDKHPAFIVQVTGAADVALAVSFAREKGLLLAVKGGGHSDFGVSCDDSAMMIDLSLLRGVRIDMDARRAWVAGATLAGLIDHEAGARGLAVPLGGASTVSVGGLALGGGIGKLGRRYGLTLDSIRALEIVTADGRVRRASERENPDLFWAARGGGGNFGVATALELNLHPIPERVLAGSINFPFDQARQVLAAYGDYARAAPDELYVDLFLAARATAETSVLLVQVCYLGPLGDADRVLQPLRRLGSVVREDVKPVSYPTAQGANTHVAARMTSARPTTESYFRAGFLDQLSEGLASAIGESVRPQPDRRINMLFLHGGGAISRTAPSATAFSHRAASHDMIFIANWPKGDDHSPHEEYIHQTWARLQPFTRGFYVNDMAGGVSPPEVAANYGPNAARLAAVKARWDPQNLFRLNANILPRGVS